MTLYARWEKVLGTYTITYQLDGGTNASSNPSSYTEGTGVSGFANATKNGYTFKGWYSAASGGNEITSISKTATGNMTLYARWEKQTHTLTFNPAGGSVSPTSVVLGEGEVYSTLPTPTKEGCTFNGWIDATGAPIKSVTMGTSDITISADWTSHKQSNITYYGVDGLTNNNPRYYYEGLTTYLTLSNPSAKEGYEFVGWSDSSSPSYYSSDYDISGKTGDLAFFAYWSGKTYNISYVMNGGTNHYNNRDTYTVGYSTYLYDPSSGPTGYVFDGWYLNGTKVTSISSTVTGNVTLTAQWKPISFTLDLSYLPEGATSYYSITATVTYGTSYILSPQTSGGMGWTIGSTQYYNGEDLGDSDLAKDPSNNGKTLYALEFK